MLFKLLPVLCTALPLVLSQSNYASQGNSIEYQPGLPPSTVLNGKVTKLDDISSMIFLNRTKAYLNCSQGSMQVELKFEEPFHGVAYADFDRNSACIFKGRGSTSAKLELPLKGCGTRQDPQRVFTNNVVVRFHPGLEMDGDDYYDSLQIPSAYGACTTGPSCQHFGHSSTSSIARTAINRISNYAHHLRHSLSLVAIARPRLLIHVSKT